MEEEDIVNTTFTGSGAAETEAGPEVDMLSSAIKKICFIRDISFKGLKEEYKLDTGSVLTEELSPVLAHSPYSSSGAQRQSSSAQDVF